MLSGAAVTGAEFGPLLGWAIGPRFVGGCNNGALYPQLFARVVHMF